MPPGAAADPDGEGVGEPEATGSGDDGVGEATGEDADGTSARAAIAAEDSAGNDGPNLAPTSRGQPTPIANPTAAITPTRTHEG
jgi:hypothetical protein